MKIITQTNASEGWSSGFDSSAPSAVKDKLTGFYHALKEFVLTKPVWGTCAGCILLSDFVYTNEAEFDEIKALREKNSSAANDDERTQGDKFGKQLGGVPVHTLRNFYGRQTASFEAPLLDVTQVTTDGATASSTPAANASSCDASTNAFTNFPAVFIRAPHIMGIEDGDSAKPLAYVDHVTKGRCLVAVRSGKMLVTTFHPELTDDNRIHAYFLSEVCNFGM